MKSQGCQNHHHHPASAHARAVEVLKSAGHKLTKPRQALIKAVSAFGRPFSTEDAFRSTKRLLRESKIDLVTVYRSLATFAELGILARVEFGDGIVRYELVTPDGHHHHHFICQECQKVEPLNPCILNDVREQENHLAGSGYTRLSHRLEFFGVCPDCTSQT